MILFIDSRKEFAFNIFNDFKILLQDSHDKSSHITMSFITKFLQDNFDLKIFIYNI